jgi:hypothetical protein
MSGGVGRQPLADVRLFTVEDGPDGQGTIAVNTRFQRYAVA